MILTSEARSRAFVEAGLWGTTTLDAHFAALAAAEPSAPAFADAGEAAVPGAVASHDRASAAARVDALGSFFAGIGLKPDTVVGIHLPAVAEAAIVILAAWRAGLVVAPLPLDASDAEIAEAIESAGIRAIVTASTVEGRDCGVRMRDIAAEHFAIRFVFGIGDGLADGLIDLGAVLADMTGEAAGDLPPPDVQRRGNPADHIAALSFARRDGRMIVVPFSHNHLAAAAALHVEAAGVESGGIIATTLAPAGLAGLVGGLATAVIGAARLDFHHVRRLGRLVADCAEVIPDHLLLPATLADAFSELFAATGEPAPALSLAMAEPAAAGLPAGVRVTELATLGGLVALSTPRPTGLPASWPLTQPVANGASGAAAIEVMLRPRIRAGERRPAAVTGDILIRGAIVPDAPWPEPASGGSGLVLPVNGDGLLRTGLTGETTPDGRVKPIPAADAVIIAGRRFDAARLDARFATFPGMLDAAAFRIDDMLLGSRVGLAYVRRPGADCSPERIAEFLREVGASPLETPALVIEVAEIARGPDGAVLRREVFGASIAA